MTTPNVQDPHDTHDGRDAHDEQGVPEAPDGPEAVPEAADVPPDDESAAKAGRAAVRRRAHGMSHHEVVAAREEAERQEPGTPGEADARARAESEEWERIEELLAVHAGAYDPDTDAFVQGTLAGEADRRKAAGPPQVAGGDEATDTLLRALARAGVLDESGAWDGADAPEGPAGPEARGASEAPDGSEGRHGSLTPAGGEGQDEDADRAVAARLARTDPAAARAVSRWLDRARSRRAAP